MRVPVSWIEEYTEGRPPHGADISERMVMSGSNIESVWDPGQGVTNVVLGRVTETLPHPDSDHLVLCRVEVGAASEEPLQIVTGAPNVRAGDWVPVALHGAVLPDGKHIKKGKLRGERSEGMLCAAQELGFDDKVVPLASKDGIWILPDDLHDEALLGKNFFEAAGFAGDRVIDFEITPNRPDCLSVRGMAREYAAVFDLALLPVQTLPREGEAAPSGKHAEGLVRVRIEKPALCARYVARVAEGITIRQSPWWMQRKLMLSGMRPINNIVDITNYVMIELGHPIHAFDIREITGGEIHVDTAADGEAFTTLDGVSHALRADMLLIKDGARGVAVAGVMGGLNSEIREDTETILIEAASFDADSVRRTSKALGLRTEASSRYEKGVPPELSAVAADRVCALIEEIGAGKALAGASDCYPAPPARDAIPLRPSRVNAVLGTKIPTEKMAAFLRRLEMETAGNGDLYHITPPYVRVDLKEEIDLVEEVARLYGYDNLEMTAHADREAAAASKSWKLRGALRDVLTAAGYSEIQTYSFVSQAGVEKLGAQGDPNAVDFLYLLNPLSEESGVMRTILLPEMLETLAHNANHGVPECFAFEIGNTFHTRGAGELPHEAISLCAAAYTGLGSSGARGRTVDFFSMKGLAETIFAKLGFGAIQFVPESDDPTWHPGRCARMYYENIRLGMLGEIHPDACARFGLETRVCALVLNFEKLTEFASLDRSYRALPKFPAASRDLALLAPEGTEAGALEKIIREKGGANLESVALFDVYRGKQVPEGKKSFAFNLVFRASDHTLTDEEVSSAVARILRAAESEAGAVLREQ